MYTHAKCCHDNKGMASHTAQEGVCLLAMTENQNQIVSLQDVYIYICIMANQNRDKHIVKRKKKTHD